MRDQREENAAAACPKNSNLFAYGHEMKTK